ncbi:tetratricopeptide repeat protein [Peptococcaceae bacterium CEB3]|nr:tetratricopeptide repeat protein [Peptococcaceae bacterium CEB3]
MKGTALKAYLQEENVRPSTLAKSCRLSESYMSRILNGQRLNPCIGVLERLGAELDLPVDRVQKLLDTPYNSFISARTLSQNATEQFFGLLKETLDALDQSDLATVCGLNDVICRKVPDSVCLKFNYLSWFEAFNSTLQGKFETAIPVFFEASQFSPRYDIEKRFKGKILGGLGAAYTARGKYTQGMKAFRQSLFLWSEGFQAAWVNMNLGTLYRRLTRYELSIGAYEYADKYGTAVTKLQAFVGLIQVSLDRKDFSAARKYVLKGYAHAKTLDSPRGKGDLYCNIAEYYFASGDLRRSEFFFRKAILFADRSGTPRTKHWACVELGALLLGRGLHKEFEATMQALESELSGGEDVLLVAKRLNVLGRQSLAERRYSQAIRLAGQGYALLVSLSTPSWVDFEESIQLLAEAYSGLKDRNAANLYIHEQRRLKRFEPR